MIERSANMEKTKKMKTEKHPILKVWKMIGLFLPKNKQTTSFLCPVSTDETKSSPRPSGPTYHIKKKKNETKRTGCFTVQVGPEKRRFWVKTELANHPLFKNLLEDAEKEFGYCVDGPIVLPCDVDFFCRVLAEIESLDGDDEPMPVSWLCSPYRYSKPKFPVKDGFGCYKRLNMSPMIRHNPF